MRKLIAALFVLGFVCPAFGQAGSQKLLELGKAYKNFMFRNEPNKDDLKDIRSGVPDSLKAAGEFIVQTVSTGNELLSQKFLSRPGDQLLKQIYIIRAINLELRKEDGVESNKLIDSLAAKEIPAYELLDNYYEMLFTAVGNKNQPFNLSRVDIKLRDYGLKDDTERGILFLEAMRFCGKTIWGYINIAKPANTSKALEYIKLFPKVNGHPYYQYNDLNFQDFEMEIVNDKGAQSFKSYYVDKYYEVLLSHLLCLSKEGASGKEKNDLLLGSILKDRSFYKYTTYKETLEGIFQEQK